MKSLREFRLVECSGTPYEIGVQWGEGCRDNLVATSKISLDRMTAFLHIPMERIVAMAMEHFPYIESFDPYLVEIMKGQAKGSGLTFEEVVTQKCMSDFTCMSMTGANSLCTAIAATGKATKGGGTIIGQNLDFLPDSDIDFLKVRHGDGLEQYILCINNWTEYTFSSAGVGLCANATFAKGHTFTLPVSAYIPRVMRQRNADDAFKILQRVARGAAYFQLADAGGRMCGLECTSDDFEVIMPERDLLTHSNHYLTERFRKIDTAPELQLDSYERMDTMKELFDRYYGRINPEIAMEILTDHNHHPNSICRHIDPSVPVSTRTLTSFVMVPDEKAIYITRGNPCENGYVRYEF